MTKSGPKTEPWGTLNAIWVLSPKFSLILISSYTCSINISVKLIICLLVWNISYSVVKTFWKKHFESRKWKDHIALIAKSEFNGMFSPVNTLFLLIILNADVALKILTIFCHNPIPRACILFQYFSKEYYKIHCTSLLCGNKPVQWGPKKSSALPEKFSLDCCGSAYSFRSILEKPTNWTLFTANCEFNLHLCLKRWNTSV